MDQYRKTPRANFIDYDNGEFFVTICTDGRKHYLGEIYNDTMHLSVVGEFLNQQLSKANEFRNDVDVSLWVIMPNHLHAIVNVKSDDIPSQEVAALLRQRNPNPSLRSNPELSRHKTVLEKYISSLKSTVTKYARKNNIEFGWQERYHDHLIRGERDGRMINDYILNNVQRWALDCFYED